MADKDESRTMKVRVVMVFRIRYEKRQSIGGTGSGRNDSPKLRFKVL
jgi:hypothetical protein